MNSIRFNCSSMGLVARFDLFYPPAAPIMFKRIALALCIVLLLVPFKLIAADYGNPTGLEPTATIAGVVTDASSGLPLSGVEVTSQSSGGIMRQAISDADGQYQIDLVPSGPADVAATRFGYLTFLEEGVVVSEDELLILDIEMTALPSRLVSGVVTDINTGWGLPARIDIDDVPDSPIFTDPVTGQYSISLPAGESYDFTVTSLVQGYVPQALTTAPLNFNLSLDWGLDVDVVSCLAPGYSASSADGAFFDFESDDGGFTGSGSWEWGTNYNWSGASCDSANYPPPGAFSGVGMWATTLNDCHPNSGDFSILSITADLAGLSSAILRWWDWYDIFETFDYGEVYVNDTLVYDRATGYVIPTDWEFHQVDLTPFVGGMATIEFRMFATTVVNRAGWFIDDVLIGEPLCLPDEGGLVVGHVRDANTDLPLSGASVESGAILVDTDAEGLFVFFAEPGLRVVTASMPGGYESQSVAVEAVDGATIGQDFDLDAGRLTIQPARISVGLEQGQSEVINLALANQGAVPLNYSLITTALLQDFEGSFPPDSWQVINNGGDCVWQRNDQVPSGRPNYAGGQGFSAAADSDRCGSGSTMNTELLSPVVDLSAATTATLSFVASYRHLGSSSFQVKVSTDGGSNWSALLEWTASVDGLGPGLPVSLDLTPYVGESEVQVSFHYQAPAWQYWAQVDQVLLTADGGSFFTLSPTSGSIAGNDQTVVELVLGAASLPIGSYQAFIAVSEDTPYEIAPIPLRLRVVDEDALFEDRFEN